ncbi:metallophosphoesterase family protein [Labrys wisconsinensis]|uniref:3',5'-cyclic AMP phosphodiesterase CpdA n=1 Tax=Labrys wisconsinensis TaxID=425677 RepID=A0ABU0JHS2_9HYPH|nr:metallophosphoesterase [Labrys wisconsinensis]MDQ0472667.1 3',5'-cyclic AMP phosphodiesterase CpdA [Labrys wisconsinensis]
MTRSVLALISDPHLSGRRAYAQPAWDHLRGTLAELAPAAVVLAGDLVLDDCDDADDRAFAAEAVHALAPTVLAVPGNHDVGDNVAEPWMEQAVTSARVEAYRAAHGHDRFATDLAGWRIIGLNAQLFDTGLPGEGEQWSWLEEAARDAGRRPIALVLHKPFAIWSRSEADQPNLVCRAARSRLAAAIGPARLQLVVSGHLHHHRTLVLDGTTHVWLPSATMIGRASHGLVPFAQRGPGYLALALDGEDASFALVATPPELAVDPERLAERFGEAPRTWPERPAGRVP